MTVFLVRHTQAGDRSSWCAPDELRPLSDRGRRQAVQLAEQLAGRGVTRVLSSPYARCVQSVEPLARTLDLMVEVDDALAEGDRFEPLVALLDQVPDGTVLCSHGDLIPATIDALVRRGMDVVGPVDHRKGARWELDRVDGAFTVGRAVPPPDRQPAVR